MLNSRSLVAIVIIFIILIFSTISLLSMADVKIHQPPKITDFQSCAQAGNPVEESYPRKCHDKAGKEYVELLPSPNEISPEPTK